MKELERGLDQEYHLISDSSDITNRPLVKLLITFARTTITNDILSFSQGDSFYMQCFAKKYIDQLFPTTCIGDEFDVTKTLKERFGEWIEREQFDCLEYTLAVARWPFEHIYSNIRTTASHEPTPRFRIRIYVLTKRSDRILACLLACLAYYNEASYSLTDRNSPRTISLRPIARAVLPLPISTSNKPLGTVLFFPLARISVNVQLVYWKIKFDIGRHVERSKCMSRQ